MKGLASARILPSLAQVRRLRTAVDDNRMWTTVKGMSRLWITSSGTAGTVVQ